MTTRPVQCNESTYTQLTSADKFIIQNNGNKILQIFASDGPPDSDAAGIQLHTNEALTDKHLTGVLWGKGEAVATVTD